MTVKNEAPQLRGKGTERVLLTLTKEERATIDAVRGTVPLATFIRDVALRALADRGR